MTTSKTSPVQKTVTFSPAIYGIAKKQAQKRGLPLDVYLENLISHDYQENENDEEIYMVDEETEKGIGKALDDYKNGRYEILRTKQDIKKFFADLDKEIEKND